MPGPCCKSTCQRTSTFLTTVVVVKSMQLGFQLIRHQHFSRELSPSYYLILNMKKKTAHKKALFSKKGVIALMNTYFPGLDLFLLERNKRTEAVYDGMNKRQKRLRIFRKKVYSIFTRTLLNNPPILLSICFDLKLQNHDQIFQLSRKHDCDKPWPLLPLKWSLFPLFFIRFFFKW